MQSQVRVKSRAALLSVERQASAAGMVHIAPAEQHRIKVHASGPVRGECAAEPFVYTRGDLDILPAGAADGWLQHEASESLVLSLPHALLVRAADELGVASAQAALEPKNHLRDARIEHIAWALEADRGAGSPAGRLIAESLGLALAVHLLGQDHKAATVMARGLARPQLQRVTEYIEARLDRELSLERLAGVAGLSMTQFKLLFRRSTGLPVHAYVVQQRVERARRLLVRGDRSIGQVALEAGFAHPSHMARSMRRWLGVLPSELRSGRASGRVAGRPM